MSIYHHLPNKAAVFAGLAELVFSQLEATVPDDSVPWQDELTNAARSYRDALRAHPNLALQVLSDTSAVSDVVVVTVEPFYRALDLAGVQPRQIVEVVNTIIDFLHGFSLGEASVQAETFDLAPDLLQRVSNLPHGQGADAHSDRRGVGRGWSALRLRQRLRFGARADRRWGRGALLVAGDRDAEQAERAACERQRRRCLVEQQPAEEDRQRRYEVRRCAHPAGCLSSPTRRPRL